MNELNAFGHSQEVAGPNQGIRFTHYPTPAQALVADYIRATQALREHQSYSTAAWVASLQAVNPLIAGVSYPNLAFADLRAVVLKLLDGPPEINPAPPFVSSTAFKYPGLYLNERQQRYLLATLRLASTTVGGLPDGLIVGEAGWEPTALRKACEPGGGGRPANTWSSLVARDLVKLNDQFYEPIGALRELLPHVTLTTLGQEVARTLEVEQSKKV